MAWLRRLGYRGLSMRDLLPHLLGDSDEKVFGITFDDGYRNVYRYAMPVLDEAGFTATNYFVARQLDGANVWDIDKGIPRRSEERRVGKAWVSTCISRWSPCI